jgi:hypothetical protein
VLARQKTESEAERSGFRFNVITRKRDFVRTMAEPESGGQGCEKAATIIGELRNQRPRPKSKSCALL